MQHNLFNARKEFKLASGSSGIKLLLRVDTPIEAEYLKHGGILPHVLRGLMAA